MGGVDGWRSSELAFSMHRMPHMGECWVGEACAVLQSIVPPLHEWPRRWAARLIWLQAHGIQRNGVQKLQCSMNSGGAVHGGMGHTLRRAEGEQKREKEPIGAHTVR